MAVLSGGVGAAKFLQGLVKAVDESEVVAIVNTGDDWYLHGLKICPDLDTITYTLSGQVNTEMGWGRANETWNAMESLEILGGETWFRLGDRDLATHLYRTQRAQSGATLDVITREITEAFSIGCTILPMTNDTVSTKVQIENRADLLDFQEYFVKLRAEPRVSKVAYQGCESASVLKEAMDALLIADQIIIAPSNPILSIEPILSLPGIKECLLERRNKVIAISPIVNGKALKGPAGKIMAELGQEASVLGIAKRYREFAKYLVIDNLDIEYSGEIRNSSMEPVVLGTVMTTPDVATGLAKEIIRLI
ncbi:MAG: 2-phospho-L-lactate transferase [Acidimicrobiales bacterium]|nr:2-phospho-L-lactate transferase [Acidimicrobiales bacterium]